MTFQRPAFRSQASAFPPGKAGDNIEHGPLPGLMIVNAGDPLECLPPQARTMIVDLERRHDEAAVLYRNGFESEQELRLEVQRHEIRIKQLLGPRGEGFNLRDDDTQVIDERRKRDAKHAEAQRLAAVQKTRSAEAQRLGALLHAIKAAIAARPSGTTGKLVEIEPPAFKGSVGDAIESRRRRVRELKADLDRVRAAPWPSGVVKQKMRQQIETLAEAGRPRVDGAIKHGSETEFATQSHQVRIMCNDPTALGFFEQPNALALLAWLHRDTLTKELEREIDALADDKGALTDEQRRQREDEIERALLATEREECALIELAQAQGVQVAYREGCDPRAVLGIAWISPPPTPPPPDAGRAGWNVRVGAP